MVIIQPQIMQEDLSRFEPLPYERRVADRESRLPALRPQAITAEAMKKDKDLKAFNKRIDHLAWKSHEVENITEELKDKVEQLEAQVEHVNVTTDMFLQTQDFQITRLEEVCEDLSVGACHMLISGTQQVEECHKFLHNYTNAQPGERLW